MIDDEKGLLMMFVVVNMSFTYSEMVAVPPLGVSSGSAAAAADSCKMTFDEEVGAATCGEGLDQGLVVVDDVEVGTKACASWTA